jgi:hypothetical protein
MLGLGMYLLYIRDQAEMDRRHDSLRYTRQLLESKDQRIEEMDADYKALVESYLRETGKVYIRPVVRPARLEPAQPSPFRFKPSIDIK